jgi:NH3-dependent NAD+ synthetase
MSWSSISAPFSLMVSLGVDSSMCLVVCNMAFDLSMLKTD